MSNPFIPFHGRIEEEELFFGREKEIKRIFDTLKTYGSVVLIGGKGIGKSSLAWRICKQARNQLPWAEKAVYLDLNLVSDDENDFYMAICEEIGIPESRGYSLAKNLRGHRVLLAIDNVGKMNRQGFTQETQNMLRSLAEGKDAAIRMVLTSYEPLDDLFKDNQEKRKRGSLAGICIEEKLKPWEEAIAHAFIEARLAKSAIHFSEEEISEIVQKSGGHPQQLMQLCYQTYSKHMEAEKKDGKKNY